MVYGARRSRRFNFQLRNIRRKSTELPTLKRAEARAPVLMRWLLVIRRVRCFVSLAGVAFLTGCGRSESDSHSGARPEGASSAANTEFTGPVEVVSQSGIEMVYLPGGEFMMGSDKGNADETPAHKVKLSAFLIDKYEVTQEMLARVRRFKDLTPITGGYPDAELPGCKRSMYSAIGFLPLRERFWSWMPAGLGSARSRGPSWRCRSAR